MSKIQKLSILMALITLSGCASLSNFFASSDGTVIITAAVDVAVATAEQKGVSAAQINSVARVALAADSGTSASLAAISTVINGKIAKLNLPPADLAAANILEIALEAAIAAKINANPKLATVQAEIALVLQDVIAVTS